MEPTLHDGDRLLVAWGMPPMRHRLALVQLPASPDGRPRPLSVKRVTSRVGDGWWVERDNPLEGVDSWLVGSLPRQAIRAVVLCRLPARRRGQSRRWVR
ncbi:MAG TPA: hypothetical protein VFJ97_06775 [Dermatophilaceae bacterium]|nr:hypothetical protein [Dermatophilaceae bacterium]